MNAARGGLSEARPTTNSADAVSNVALMGLCPVENRSASTVPPEARRFSREQASGFTPAGGGRPMLGAAYGRLPGIGMDLPNPGG
jgi:hypothetical protein